MSGLLRDFERVSSRAPCAICGHGSSCLRARDGFAQVICSRISSPRRWGAAGWFHRVPPGDRAQVKFPPEQGPGESRLRLITDACLARAAERPETMCALAGSLGVGVSALHGLSVGLDERGWSTWPTHDHLQRVVGIRERGRGQVRPVAGSKSGLFLPNIPEQSQVLVTVGEFTCAAALSLGFFAIGRPPCEDATALLVRWIFERTDRDLVVVADLDSQGRGLAGATRLAARLAPACRSVRVVLPPRGARDLRDALKVGVDQPELIAAIERAPTVRPALRVVSGEVR